MNGIVLVQDIDSTSSLHVVGIFFFTKGFLLTRLVLDHKSDCSTPPIELSPYLQKSRLKAGGCWYPQTFERAVVVIIDALRYDFTIPSDRPHHFHNAFTVLHETAIATPQNSFLLPFIADPPTTTLQRLKGLTTGTLPTFIDMGSNFAGTAIEEDNLLTQLRDAGKTLVHLGDDTWHSLFPGYFHENLTRSYDSFNVWDLHTVDDGVTQHLLPLLEPANVTKWDVIFGHYLGVDHAGHRYGPDHPAMTAKLQQMDNVFREIISKLDEQTLLVVMGDHGMDTKGDHGGESDDEVEAALWMYSKKGVFGRSKQEFIQPPLTAKERPVAQIDLVPTLSLLLGMPIPFNNLGEPIEEAFIGSAGNRWQDVASINALTAAQINKYQREYAVAHGFDESTFKDSTNLWGIAKSNWDKYISIKRPTTSDARTASLAFSKYQQETLGVCRGLWARFNIPSMLCGVLILLAAAVVLSIYARGLKRDVINLTSRLLRSITVFSTVGVLFGATLCTLVAAIPFVDASLLCLTAGGMIGFGLALGKLPNRPATLTLGSSGFVLLGEIASLFPWSIWGWLAFIFTVSQSAGFASNSFTIWEDEVLLFFLATFACVGIVSSYGQTEVTDRVLGVSQSCIFLFFTRLSSLSRLCREEQMPFCKSTYYASASSSTSAPWQVLIPFALAIGLPSLIKSYYQGTLSYQGSAIFWIGSALRMGLLGSAIFWSLDAADDGEWFNIDKGMLKTVKTAIAQLVLATAFAAGTTTFAWAKPCVNIEVAPSKPDSANSDSAIKPKSVTILGYANVHGSRFFLMFSNWLLATILLQKPMGGGSLGVLSLQILAFIEIIDSNDLSKSSICSVVLGVLGNFHFFKTGHQATLSSIQWESAFVPLKEIRYPWSPMLVTLNAFGAQILAAVAVPLLVLWKQPVKKKGLLGDVAKALATHILYYAVINVATTMWAGWLRRHLMLYRIFSPRFMTGAAVLMVVDLVGIVVALGSTRWNFLSVAEVFGWE